MNAQKAVAVVHSGGDTPVSNGVLYGIISSCQEHGFEVLGFQGGWRGVLARECQVLDKEQLFGIHTRSGIVIHSTRVNPLKEADGISRAIAVLKEKDIKVVFTESGDDGIKIARACHDQGIACIHVAKTIDDDFPETDITFGAWSARNLVAGLMRRLVPTTESHEGVLFIRCMGRKSGSLTLYGAKTGGCHLLLIPEFPNWTLAGLAEAIKKVHGMYGYCMVAVAETLGQKEVVAYQKKMEEKIGEPPEDPFGHRSIAEEPVTVADILATIMGKPTGLTCRAQNLDRLCRSGEPDAWDINLALDMGLYAGDLAAQGQFGRVVVVKRGRITSIPMEQVKLGKTRHVSRKEYEKWLRLAPVRFPEI